MVALVYRGTRGFWKESRDLQDDIALASMARDHEGLEPSRKWHTEFIHHS